MKGNCIQHEIVHRGKKVQDYSCLQEISLSHFVGMSKVNQPFSFGTLVNAQDEMQTVDCLESDKDTNTKQIGEISLK